MSVTRRMLALGFAVLAGAGCYGKQMLQQPVAVERIDQNAQSLLEQNAAMDTTIKRLEAALIRQEEMIRALRADTQTRLQEVTESVQALNNQIGDSYQRRPLYTRAPEDNLAPPTISPIPQKGDSSSSGVPLTPAQAKAIYDNAYLDLSRGNYSLALIGFRDYLTKIPDSELSDNAQYWIGECSYAQRDFRKAVEDFSKVETTYPKGDKVPAAKLKIAYSLLQLEDRAGARKELRDLIARFPNSEEASQARSKLQSLE
jgi:tol-pal system protein YbgF